MKEMKIMKGMLFQLRSSIVFISFIIFITFILLPSCNKSAQSNSAFAEIDKLIDQNPDSALLLLDSLAYSGKVDTQINPEYILLDVRAKDKARKDISSDTLIFTVRNYFQNRKDLIKAAQANIYSGRVSFYRKDYDKALEYYLQAKEIASKTGDDDLQGSIAMFIGEVYFRTVMYNQAIASYNDALAHFSTSPGLYHKALHPYREIAKVYDLTKQPDSAFIYFDKGLAIAENRSDTAMIRVFKQNMATAHSKTGEYEKAVGLLKEVLDLNPNDRNLSYVYRNLADIYKGENQIDSAIYYLDQSLQYADPGNNNLLANIYSLYYKIEAERGNYRAALEYQKHFVDNMTNVVGERQQQQLSSVEKKYQVELMQNQLRKKTIEQQQILLICGLLLLVILIISFLLYRKSDTNKKRSEEFYRKMDEMDSLSKNIEQNANEYQRAFSEQFSIMEKTVALEYLLNEEERLQGKKLIQKFNEIVYDQKEGVNWEKLYNTINGMSGGYLDALRERLPQLNEVEFRICCLTYAGLNNTQISIILRLAIDTIQAKKTGIRKKLGMEKNQNLRAYLQNV